MQVRESVCSDSLRWSVRHLLQRLLSAGGHEKKKGGVGGKGKSSFALAFRGGAGCSASFHASSCV